MGSEFARVPTVFRQVPGGMKVNVPPDAVPAGKYPYLQNVRGYLDSAWRTRPGQVLKFTDPNAKTITDIRAYTRLSTDDLPRDLARNSQDNIILDNGVVVGTLAGAGASKGAVMIPFRPGESPTSYMYIANGSDYQKFSAPDASNNVTKQKVGIQEPQVPPDAGILQQQLVGFAAYAIYNAGGTSSGGAGGNRGTGTVGSIFRDPTPGSNLWSLQVNTGNTVSFQKLMPLIVGTTGLIVLDVFPPLPSSLTIQSIFYFSGTTGHCVIVPSGIGTRPQASEQTIYATDWLVALRRGAIIQVGTELALVWSVTTGPGGGICIETSTTAAHTTADLLSGVLAIQVLNGAGTSGQTFTPTISQGNVGVGVGTWTAVLPNSPFVAAGFSFTPDDYLVFGVNVDNLANLIEMKVLIDVGDGTFTSNFYYYTVRPSDIAQAVANTATQLAAAQTTAQRTLVDELNVLTADGQLQTISGKQLPPGSSQWGQIVVPISALTRVGSDNSLSLQNANHVQFLFNASATIHVQFYAPSLFGGFQADVGDVGAPYLYRVRPRSSVTGARGNPSPVTRYGVNPRRQSVIVSLPSAAYDQQIDTWDIERYGGSVTSWRMVGSTPSTNTAFTDNVNDAAAQEGEELDLDNFEPWPSLDLPFNVTATSVTGFTALVTVPAGTNVLRFLPGNLVQLGGNNVFTLWTRPTLVSGTTYLFQFVENAGALTNVPCSIYEPEIANQLLPYMWGPDATGTVFAVGDPLRAGTLYFAKNYAPDSAPDTYNIEITPPSEPLLGGEIVDGLGYVSSPERWWALYPTPDNPAQRYNPVQLPVTRGLAAPYGHCNDGSSFYWWAKDGIYSSTKGNLTDNDLYGLFPHEGVVGQNATYAGFVTYAPDYSRTGTFRLAYANGYLYATYQDSSGTYRVLVYDIRHDAWIVDAFTCPVSVFYHPEQQAGTLTTALAARYDELLEGDTVGQVFTETDLSNDGTCKINCVVVEPEFDGGDVRAPKQWGDGFLDCVPAAIDTPLVVTPMSLGASVAPATAFTPGSTRTRQAISVGGIVVSDFLGLVLTWTEDFTKQSVPTVIHIWQPSFVIQPAKTIEWFTFGTTFGLEGYMHIRQIAFAWVSTAQVTVAITAYDGTSPANLTLPSTGGLYQKVLFPLTFNKGQLYKFHASSANPFQLFFDDCEIHVAPWRRDGAYTVFRGLGGRIVDAAPI